MFYKTTKKKKKRKQIKIMSKSAWLRADTLCGYSSYSLGFCDLPLLNWFVHAFTYFRNLHNAFAKKKKIYQP